MVGGGREVIVVGDYFLFLRRARKPARLPAILVSYDISSSSSPAHSITVDEAKLKHHLTASDAQTAERPRTSYLARSSSIW